MKVIIIEDELPACRRLAKMITEVRPAAEILACLESIQEVTAWMALNEPPQLVFCDIHLADGSAFDLLKQVDLQAPIIFTTAYDQYALDAFKTNSIAYLLKPVKMEDLTAAIEKNEKLRSYSGAAVQEVYRSRFLIRFGEYLKTLMVTDIAYCYSENKATYARTFDGRTHPMDHNLDALEQLLDPKVFFRLNRQYLVHLNALRNMRTHTKSRVIVQLDPQVGMPQVVSSERASDFKQWLADHK